MAQGKTPTHLSTLICMAELFLLANLRVPFILSPEKSLHLLSHMNLNIAQVFSNHWRKDEKSCGHEGSGEKVDLLGHLNTLAAELFLWANLLGMFDFVAYESFRLELLRIFSSSVQARI